jgi:hypothetical protein
LQYASTPHQENNPIQKKKKKKFFCAIIYNRIKFHNPTFSGFSSTAMDFEQTRTSVCVQTETQLLRPNAVLGIVSSLKRFGQFNPPRARICTYVHGLNCGCSTKKLQKKCHNLFLACCSNNCPIGRFPLKPVSHPPNQDNARDNEKQTWRMAKTNVALRLVANRKMRTHSFNRANLNIFVLSQRCSEIFGL